MLSFLRLASNTSAVTLWCDCQGLTLPPLLSSTVDTTYCDVVLIVCNKTRQFILCDIGSDVQTSSIWDLGSIGGNVDEIEISTVSTTQCPVHGNIHNSIGIFSEVHTREKGHRRRA